MSLLMSDRLTLPALITPVPYDYFGNIDKAGPEGYRLKLSGNIAISTSLQYLTQPHFRGYSLNEQKKSVM